MNKYAKHTKRNGRSYEKLWPVFFNVIIFTSGKYSTSRNYHFLNTNFYFLKLSKTLVFKGDLNIT